MVYLMCAPVYHQGRALIYLYSLGLSESTRCCCVRQAYVWEKNRDVSEWLQSQLADDKWPQSVLCENIRCLKRDYVMQQIRTYVALCTASNIIIEYPRR